MSATQAYSSFVDSKRRRFAGTTVPYQSRNPSLYPFQVDIVQRALDRGRYAIFADCGLGKTLMELEWAANIPGRILLLAPIAVSHQIQHEAERFGFSACVRTGQDGVGDEKVTLTNYEKLHRFHPDAFEGIILDESSILKAYTGKIRTQIIQSFHAHRYKLAATATPAPNDFMELGNHAEFLGAMSRSEMLSMFFVHDGGSTQDWRLKKHAVREFWRWVGSWACMIGSPSDLGYENDGFELPPLTFHHEVVESDFEHHALLPGAVALDLNERRRARRSSMVERVARAAHIDDGSSPCLFWCDLNDESHALARAIDDAVEVKGADTEAHKRGALVGFAEGGVRALVTKPRIAGWGMNWQRCSRMAFVGLSDSYEAFYQATRRCWRYGQESPVSAHLIYSESERAVVDNVLKKSAQHESMREALMQEVMSA